ncbi:MAG: KGK domain-containing protein [Snowella sp.]|nr:KGK domain-containing protein [Snowella sp.]
MTISYNNFLESLNDDDVLELFDQLVKSKDLKFALDDSFGEPIQQRLVDHLKHRGIKTQDKREIWFDQGAKCRILKAGSSGWKKGRVKINVTVEFIPDEPESMQYESLLDEFRQEIN